MLDFACAILAALLLGSLVGHGVHALLHQPWAGPLYRAHCDHHFRAYPRSDVISHPPYRSSGKASGFLWFPPLVAPPLFAALYLGYRWGVPPLCLGAFAGVVAIVGVLHGVVHDRLHLVDRRAWGRWWAQLRAHHVGHHADVSKNLGIVWFGWDRVFGTYRRPTVADRNTTSSPASHPS